LEGVFCVIESRMIFDDLPWAVAYEDAIKKLHVDEDDEEDFKEVYDTTISLMKPVFYLGKENVVSNDGHVLKLGTQEFKSRVVCVNLKDCDYVYPYVGTSGRAAYEYSLSLKDPLFNYWSDAICEMALISASVAFKKRIFELFGTENVFSVNPGSVIDWPISEQAPLFDLLGNVFEKTGIILTDTFLMRPVKSGSGMLYVSDKHFENCMLCARSECPNRRANFDSEMFKKEYGE